MLCRKCEQRNANIQLTMQINGNRQVLPLCSQCFAEEKQKLGASMGPSSFGGFDDLFGQYMKQGLPEMNNPKAAAGNNHKGGGFLDEYGRNLNQAAKAGLIDPVIGREEEIERVIEILNRRNKNNPVLIGEPGVGKTAIAEGLSLKITSEDVPAKLKNKEVYLLDVASLVANTGIRGQFEERMKGLIKELQERKNVLLFVDEVHLLVGAGSAEGSMDAGNILKPALARGELQLIGATTLKEYRQIEKDAALERRFQPVQIGEPSRDKAIEILNGLKEKYESYHQVEYSEEAIRACVDLSMRYIQDRFLPDKAIDLMDEAGAKLNLRIKTGSKEEIQQRLAEIEREKQAVLAKEEYEKAAKLHEEELKLEREMIGEAPRKLTVDVSLIQDIIERKTGIPVGKLQSEDMRKMKYLAAELSQKVIGQEEAVRKVAKAVRRSRAGLKAPGRPIGSFLFVGQTGVGKTELSKALAEQLFGSRDALIRLDMSEYMEKHSVSKLIGSPPGYVGHEEAGQLTERVRRQPYSIILLDEIEKAHPDVQHLFLQILDDGRLTDSQGRTVSFKDSVIIMTSNAGTSFKPIQVGFGQSDAVMESSILDSLGSFFKPEFLNRFDSIIEFEQLEKEHLLEIVDLLLGDLHEMLEEQGLALAISPEAKEKLAELGYHPQFGARPLRRVIQDQLEDPIADYILDNPETKKLLAVLEDGCIKIRPEKEVPAT